MSLSTSIKPISYVKAHAAELIKECGQGPRVITITQNGEAKAVLLDIRTYEETHETLALLKILAQSANDIAHGRYYPLGEAMARLRKKIKDK